MVTTTGPLSQTTQSICDNVLLGHVEPSDFLTAPSPIIEYRPPLLRFDLGLGWARLGLGKRTRAYQY